MFVCSAALGFIGYGVLGIYGAGIGAALGLFIGMVVDTILLIIYSNKLETTKTSSQHSHKKRD